MYSLPAYGRMVGDPVRFGAYRDALGRAIVPGSRVLDLGAGPGVFSVLAAVLGAQRVYGVESDPTVEWLRPLAEANGVADRVKVLRGNSTDLEPPEKVDVLMADLRGVLPFFGQALPSLIDARDRWLEPSGRLIARRDILWAAPVEAPEAHARQLGGFGNVGFGDGGVRGEEGLDLSLLARAASNHWSRVELGPSALLAEPARLGELDYASLTDPHFEAVADFRFHREGTCHGLAVWFDSEVDAETSFSNRPSSRGPLYGQAFFPWSRPAEAGAEETTTVRFDARLVGEDYVFRWRRGPSRSRGSEFAGEPRWVEDQATFHGAPLGTVDLPRPSAP